MFVRRALATAAAVVVANSHRVAAYQYQYSTSAMAATAAAGGSGGGGAGTGVASTGGSGGPAIFDIECRDAMGKGHTFGEYARGKVTLVVNTASGCGFTPQFAGLQELYDEYKDRGFTVLAFPSNDFKQELDTDAAAHDFACTRYKTTFPMFARTTVTGASAHPLFKTLGKEKPGLMGREAPFWNFQKFLVGPDGHVIERFAPKTNPAELKKDIEAALAPRSVGLPSTGVAASVSTLTSD